MKVPSPGESISEVAIAKWLVKDGDYVYKDQAIAEIDSDKATLELPAEESGIIKLKAKDKTTGDINILQVIAKIQVTPNGETINIELIQSFESGNGGYRAISMSLGALRAEEVNPFIESIADAKTREIVTEMIESVSQKNQTEKLAASLDRLGAALEGLTYSQMDKSLRIILTIMQSNPVAGH